MATRVLFGETWAHAIERVARFQGPLAVCWASLSGDDGSWHVLGVTIRGGTSVADRDFTYPHARLCNRMRTPAEVVHMLRSGVLPGSTGLREFREMQASEGNGYWLTSNAIWGTSGPLPCPSYYFAVNASGNEMNTHRQLNEPLFASGQPYFPTGQDAVLELLYGITRDQGRRDIFNQIAIHLPYTDAFLYGVRYVDGEGVVVSVGEVVPGTARGHEVQALWKVQPAETAFQRGSKILVGAGPHLFEVGAHPAYFSAALQDADGQLVDLIELRTLSPRQSQVDSLPPDALPDALDLLASVWRNVTQQQLYELRRIASVAGLTMPVATRNDFSARLSDLSDVLKSIRVPDNLVDPRAAKGLAEDSSLARLKIALKEMLPGADADLAIGAVETLQGVVRVRVALQHADTKPDLPTALARLSIDSSVGWPQAWELIRHAVVSALRDLRRALESTL